MSSNCADKTLDDFLEGDVKPFSIEGANVMIAQAIIPSINEISFSQEEIEKALMEHAKRAHADLYVMVFTDILQKGSYFFYGGKLRSYFSHESFLLMENILSRKKQIVPMITKKLKENL